MVRDRTAPTGSASAWESDGTTTRVDVIYTVEPIDAESHEVSLGAGDWKVVRQLINRAAKRFPQLDPAQAQAHVRKTQKIPNLERVAPSKPTSGGVSAAFVVFWLFFFGRPGTE